MLYYEEDGGIVRNEYTAAECIKRIRNNGYENHGGSDEKAQYFVY